MRRSMWNFMESDAINWTGFYPYHSALGGLVSMMDPIIICELYLPPTPQPPPL